jgi:Reverse transcriptase (RNA-dependent DNA polymerase)
MLDIPDEVYNWMRDFFEGHAHCTKFEGIESLFIGIRASVFQGSAIGPASYVVTAADLRTIHDTNKLLKYADDTYLIVPAVTSQTVEQEISHIADWSQANNLRLNHNKSQEMIFVARRARRSHVNLPDPIPGIVRVEGMTVLGVHVNDRLAASDHVTEAIAACARTMYALRTLKAHGLTGHALHTVFKATVLAKLLYAAPAWSGFCLAADRDRTDSFLRRCKRLGFCDPDTPSIAELFGQADETLFDSVRTNDCHVLYPLLPAKTEHRYNLRRRRHNHELITKTTTLNENHFIVRMIYKNCY